MVFTRLTDLFLMIIIAFCLKNEVITGNLCEDTADLYNTRTIKMCEDGNVTSIHVVLDTHDSEITGETTCTCSVTNGAAALILSVGDEVNPNTTDCGSKITALDGATNRTYECKEFPGVPLAIQSFSIIWEMMAPGDSKYCLNITSIMHAIANFTVVCEKPVNQNTEVTTSISTTMDNTTIPITMDQTTSHESTSYGPYANTTTTVTDTTDVATKVNDLPNISSTSTLTSYLETTTNDIQTTTVTKLSSLTMKIVIPAAGGGGGLLLVIIIIVSVACCCRRKRKKLDEEKEDDNRKDYIDPNEQDDTTNTLKRRIDVNNECESNQDADGLKDNILYHSYIKHGKQEHTSCSQETVDGNYSSVPDFKTEAAGAMYAQVQKKKDPETAQKDNGEEMEMIVKTGSNDVYAVVNKSLKNKPNTGSYTTEDGLVYLQVDHTIPTKKESSPSVNDKDAVIVGKGIDTVNYTEVNFQDGK